MIVRILAKMKSNKLKQGSLIIIGALLLFACTAPEKVAFSPISGFGGTGYKPSGFGGTGIVGTITQFGSIWVNGVEIEYDEKTQVTSNLLVKDTLKIGEQVVLETLRNDDLTQTNKISVYYPIAGKITHLGKDQIILNNHFIVKTSNTKLDEGIQLKMGEYVAVNGYEISSKTWVATRINYNPQHKVFYQDIPRLNFSKYVKQVLIESSASQIKNWERFNGVEGQLSQKHERIIIVGRVDDKGEIQVDAVESYSHFPKSASKMEMFKKFKDLIQRNKKSSRKGMKRQSSNKAHGSGKGHGK